MIGSGKTVLITGASRGIGKQLALDCGSEGYNVAVNCRTGVAEAEEVAATIEASGGRALVVPADVADAASVSQMMRTIADQWGGVDCVVNNAGVGDIIDIDAITEADFSRTLNTNLTSAFLVSQAAIEQMTERGGGRLIFMSSTAARVGGLISAAYAASKAGMEGLMHYYANYLLPRKITANAIAPALVESDMVNQMKLPDPAVMPLGRLGRTDEVWPLVKMMIETEYMTGQTIQLNAGRYMT